MQPSGEEGRTAADAVGDHRVDAERVAQRGAGRRGVGEVAPDQLGGLRAVHLHQVAVRGENGETYMVPEETQSQLPPVSPLFLSCYQKSHCCLFRHTEL